MGNTKLTIPQEFDTASKDQRIAYVQQLWDRIAIPIPEHHKRTLTECMEAYRKTLKATIVG